jgi:nucleoid-associated protein YgaU
MGSFVMTSDAKIGLLLGLLFIFIIAFVINGLPRFRNITNGSEMTTNMVSSQNDTQPIGSRERQAQGVFNWTEQSTEQTYQEPQPVIEQKEDVRFKIQLPAEVPVTTDNSIMEIADQVEPITPEPAEPAPPVQVPEEKEEKIIAKKPEPAKSVGPRFYVVSEDDSLGLVSVAKKCYGPEQGNKKINIDRIYEANKTLLKSPDQIFVGQKLIIPPLVNSETDTKETKSTFADSILEKVKSIGKNLSNRPEKAKKSVPYIVQEDDNLWRIAVEQLGNGSRYKEISKLNANILKDENDLTVGMLLRMPAR